MNFDNYSCDNQMSIFDFTRESISITKPIRLIELFAGYGSQAMALKRIGAKFEHYRVVEFDKYAIASYNAVHGTDFPTMDITKIHAEDLNICDTAAFTYLLTYSFPCTDLSVAGKQAGMSKGSGTRSGLLWEVERILTEIRDGSGELPQILFMENVPQVHGKKNIDDFKKWLGFLESLGYTNYWQDLNAKYYVAQNRNRCFMFSFLGNYLYNFPQAIPLEKEVKEYLEKNVDERYYINNEKAYKLIKYFINNGSLSTSNFNYRICIDLSINEPKERKVANCILSHLWKDGNAISNYNQTNNGVIELSEKSQYRLRKLTVRECGRLMGVSDEDIDKMAAVNSNTQLYKQFGNSIVVDVMCAMFRNLNIEQE